MEKNKIGQYGKRNPLFMYQCAAGYSIKASPVKYSASGKIWCLMRLRAKAEHAAVAWLAHRKEDERDGIFY